MKNWSKTKRLFAKRYVLDLQKKVKANICHLVRCDFKKSMTMLLKLLLKSIFLQTLYLINFYSKEVAKLWVQ